MANVINPRPSNRTHAVITLSTAADGLSEEINLTGHALSYIATSTAWTAASLGFQGAVPDSTSFYPVYDTLGNFLTYPTSASRIIAFDNASFAGLQKIKLASLTTAGVAVAQAAARTLILGLS